MPDERFHVSRRDVLKGAGAAAVLSSVRPVLAGEKAGPEGLRRCGPDAVKVRLLLNGEKRELSVEPRVTLLDALRDHLDLTGTKRVCDRGACGACTVWLDGKTCNACMVLAVDADGREVRTVEGLAEGGKLSPVQAAFVKEDAVQCGFCTSGMLMSCAALLRDVKHPTEAQVRAAVAGNLCRCGTYPHVFRACKEASR